MGSEVYTESYFMRGKQEGLSLYENYRWMPEQTLAMAQRMVDHLGIVKGETILDFGCARGYLVKALRILGHEAYGIDASEWAIKNADEDAKPYVGYANVASRRGPAGSARGFDWVIAKDVLEHIPYVSYTVKDLLYAAIKGVFVVVPLSPFDAARYIINDYEADITHIQRLTLLTWANMFIHIGWHVEVAYRVPGIKDNWYKEGWERGNGFITAKRI